MITGTRTNCFLNEEMEVLRWQVMGQPHNSFVCERERGEGEGGRTDGRYWLFMNPASSLLALYESS